MLNSGPALAPAKPVVALTSHVSWLGGWLAVTLCSSVLEQATDQFYMVLESGQIGHVFVFVFVFVFV